MSFTAVLRRVLFTTVRQQSVYAKQLRPIRHMGVARIYDWGSSGPGVSVVNVITA